MRITTFNMHCRVSAVLLSVIVSGFPQINAQSADAPDKGKQVVDAAVAALGGERFLDMHTRVASGRIYSFFKDEMSGSDIARTYVEYVDGKPLGIREREVLGKKQDYSYLFLPDQGWDITFRGARPVEDEAWERYRRSTENDILYILKVRHNEPGFTYDYIANEVHVSTHVEVVDITDSQNRTVRVSFDYNTKLPVRQTFTWLDPDTRYRNEEVTEFDKWRNAGDGVMWPFTIERSRNGYKSYQMFASSVEVNAPIPTNTFELPAGAKVLKKVN
ncbi:MAG: hypothetical protein JO108_03000 [Acidobacteriaceae bacterium]|nr:hypothetical protein [Acidobacteriaceae bacterium]